MVTMREFSYVVELLDGFAGQEVVTDALRHVGIDRTALSLKTKYVPYANEAVLIEAVSRATADRQLGAKLGRDFRYSEYGTYAVFVLGAPDLGSALERGRRALTLTHPGSFIQFRQTDTHIVVGRDSSGLTVNGHRHLDEGALFVIRTVVRHFLGPDWVPDWVELPESSAEDVKSLELMLNAKVHTRDGPPSIAIRLSDLATLNPKTTSFDDKITLDDLAALMGVIPVQTVADAVTQILEITFANSNMSESSVARHLAIGPRTLQRALFREGLSFSHIRASFKENKAKQLLKETSLPIETIAKTLSYKDARSFRRAFNQWTGLSPRDFRERDFPENEPHSYDR